MKSLAKKSIPVFLVLLSAGLVACKGASMDRDDALAARSLEVQYDSRMKLVEVEYHINPSEVPVAVREAMDALHPGGRFTAAEKEYNDGKLYYELSREVNGMEIEAMFTPDGRLHSEEIEVRMSKVPEPVRATAKGTVFGGTVRKWEEIRDADRELVQYHVKVRKGDLHYKLAIALDGKLVATWREIPAEIEVRSD